jgi:hypothetical protein
MMPISKKTRLRSLWCIPLVPCIIEGNNITERRMRECAGRNFERCVAGHVCSDVMSAGPLKEIEGNVAMKSKKLEVVKGRGNVFRDLGHRNVKAGDAFE